MSGALSLTTMTGPMLAAAFKFLFDRANSFLDRRSKDKADAGGETSEVGDGTDVDKLKAAMKVLKVYESKGIQVAPDDADLVESLSDVHAELERLEGRPIDLADVARAGVRIDMKHEDVDGTVTGLSVGEVDAGAGAEVVIRTATVKRGGDVTGMRIDGRLG
ncbi:hypothetical protein [Amycolatopsis japonica]